MAAHSSILAWKIPWTEEPGGLPSMGSQRSGHDFKLSTHATGLSALGVSLSHFVFQSTPRFVTFLPPSLQWLLMPIK